MKVKNISACARLSPAVSIDDPEEGLVRHGAKKATVETLIHVLAPLDTAHLVGKPQCRLFFYNNVCKKRLMPLLDGGGGGHGAVGEQVAELMADGPGLCRPILPHTLKISLKNRAFHLVAGTLARFPPAVAHSTCGRAQDRGGVTTSW